MLSYMSLSENISEKYLQELGDNLFSILRLGSFETKSFIPTWSDIDFNIVIADDTSITEVVKISSGLNKEYNAEIGVTYCFESQVRLLSERVLAVHNKALNAFLENQIYHDVEIFKKDDFVIPEISMEFARKESIHKMFEVYAELIKVITREFDTSNVEKCISIFRKAMKMTFVIVKSGHFAVHGELMRSKKDIYQSVTQKFSMISHDILSEFMFLIDTWGNHQLSIDKVIITVNRLTQYLNTYTNLIYNISNK